MSPIKIITIPVSVVTRRSKYSQYTNVSWLTTMPTLLKSLAAAAAAIGNKKQFWLLHKSQPVDWLSQQTHVVIATSYNLHFQNIFLLASHQYGYPSGSSDNGSGWYSIISNRWLLIGFPLTSECLYLPSVMVFPPGVSKAHSITTRSDTQYYSISCECNVTWSTVFSSETSQQKNWVMSLFTPVTFWTNREAYCAFF